MAGTGRGLGDYRTSENQMVCGFLVLTAGIGLNKLPFFFRAADHGPTGATLAGPIVGAVIGLANGALHEADRPDPRQFWGRVWAGSLVSWRRSADYAQVADDRAETVPAPPPGRAKLGFPRWAEDESPAPCGLTRYPRKL